MEILPSTAASKRTRVARAKPAAAAHADAPLLGPNKPTLRKKKSKAQAAGPDLSAMIATAAFYLSERRNFMPGHELEDWLEAEQQIKSMLK